MTALDLSNILSQHGNIVRNKESIRKEKLEAEDKDIGIIVEVVLKVIRDEIAQYRRKKEQIQTPGVPSTIFCHV